MTFIKSNGGILAVSVLIMLIAIMSPRRPAGAHAEGGGKDETIVLSLERAIELGLQSDESLMQAVEGIRSAEAGLSEARAGRLPSLSIGGQYARNIRKPVLFLPSDMAEAFDGVTKIELGEDNDFTANAQLTYNLWTAGRISAGIGAGREMLEAMKYQETATADMVRFRVKKAYFDVLLAGYNLTINEKAVQETREAVRVTGAGFDEGTVSRFDLLRAEVELENRQPQLVAAHNTLDQALIVLRRVCGLEPGTAVELSDTLSAVEQPADLEHYINAMKSSSSHIRALEHQVSAVQQGLRFEKAQRWPVLQLGANYLLQGQWSDRYLPEKKHLARSAALTLGFQIPIFDGFMTRSRIDRARAELRSAEIELEKVTREKETAVRVAYLVLDNAIVSLQGRRRAVEMAEEAHRLALVRLRNGLATPVERLDAELAMTMARGQFAEALYACNIALAQLELAAGVEGDNGSFTSGEKENDDE